MLMKILLALLVALNLSDAFLTERLIEEGTAREGNPFLIGLVGTPVFIILKVAGVLLCGLLLWDIHRRHPRLARVSTTCFVAVYSGIVGWNLSLLIA